MKKLLAPGLPRMIGTWMTLAILLVGCSQGSDPESTTPPGAAGRTFGPLERLRQIEQNQGVTYTDSPARHDHLFAYFRESNPRLMKHLEALDQTVLNGKDHQGMTLIHAPGGMGKSYFIREIDWPGAEDKPKLVKLSRELPARSPDLVSLDQNSVLNQLPDAPAAELADWVAQVIKPDSVLVLLDDLDEIHADTAKALLSALEDGLSQQNHGFSHVIVFGRSESMWPWSIQRPKDSKVEVTVLPLLAPRYLTWGDIEFRVQDYYQFLKKDSVPEWVLQDVKTQLGRFAFLRDFFRPLSMGNFVLDDSIARYATQTEGEFLEFKLKDRLFEDLLRRNQGSHGRPGPEDRDYQRLLTLAALFPLQNGREWDEEGYFEVLESDTLQLQLLDQKMSQEYRLSNVLDRSGLVVMDMESSTRRYRFEPLWIQRHLMTRYSAVSGL